MPIFEDRFLGKSLKHKINELCVWLQISKLILIWIILNVSYYQLCHKGSAPYHVQIITDNFSQLQLRV